MFLAPLLLSASLVHGQETVERHLTAMGTHLGVEVTAPTRAEALAASEAAVRAIEACERRLSTWTDASELAQLNAHPVGEPFQLSPELARDLALARDVWRSTEGAFDPGLGALVEAFGLRDGGATPTDAELSAALATGGFASLKLEGTPITSATRLRDGLSIEEGGFGKGVGLEAALTALRDAGVLSAQVDLGGQVALLPAASQPALEFAVADPRDRAATACVVEVARGSLATSGNSERGVVIDGQSAAHILDPRTGRPAADFGSVTVWTEDAAIADALSTALYAMGPDAGLAWANANPGVDALFLLVDDEGALSAHATHAWADRVTATLDGLSVTAERGPIATATGAAGSLEGGSAPKASKPAAASAGRDDDEERLSALEATVEAFGHELERTILGDIVPPIGDSFSGLGPSASKVYNQDRGLSVGGYGEAIYRNYDGSTSDTFDMLRAILYFGYKFNEDWLLNFEIEHEHANETFVEFAYIDYMGWEDVNARAGLVLLPMGFLNELHEPSTFLAATRPDTESKIIPSTWREGGVGVYGDAGPVEYRAYVVNGLDGSGFGAGGLRGGRQKGSKALAEDLALVGRVDYVDVPGLVLGGSVYVGDSGHGQAGIGDVGTTIYELHGEWRDDGLWVRFLAAMAEIDDAATLNAGLGLTGAESVGEELEGMYLELGYDVMQLIDPEAGLEISPYVRFEAIDTQAEVPTGFSSDPANDEEITTLGVHIRPIPELVFKAELQDRDQGDDSINIGLGWVF